MAGSISPGSIVRCRNRDWVRLPGDDPDWIVLRPLTGSAEETVVINSILADKTEVFEERIRPATFPLPSGDEIADATGASLLWQAARLCLREGASPFRSLGKISIRPRTYQFVPLLMALRLSPVRMLIADDVGVGKTVEALLIARELLERGEIRRVAVLCPPALCDQWQKEMEEKFGLEAVVIRSGTVGSLERRKPHDKTIYQYFPLQVVSIDYLKTDRNKHAFLVDCPDLVIVDEAHGCAQTSTMSAQHQRHELLRLIAASPNQNLLLLTATPHSGIDEGFRSLLRLLDADFGQWDMAALRDEDRAELARHFVQRTRKDITVDWEQENCFPTRESLDVIYRLSKPYQDLFSHTLAFCSEIVQSGEELDKRKQRVRYWGALALLRCVMSSPAAAMAALESRHDKATESEEPTFASFVFESTDSETDDEQPIPPIEAAEQTLSDSEKRKLRELGRLAKAIHQSESDTKLAGCVAQVTKLLDEGFEPIVWCRYIATAEDVARGLEKALKSKHPEVRVLAITGRIDDEERRAKIDELGLEPRRVLVATDCLSEGINLQQSFSACLHYDLPWNPNRLEQREGRIDRFGQPHKVVKAIRYYSPDSAIDGVVLNVLLNKAREIHKALGTHVPVPDDSESVTQAILNALFLKGSRTPTHLQPTLDFGDEEEQVAEFHRKWDRDVDRERVSRTKFAQRALKPDEVRKELEATDAVLGDDAAVKEFVLAATQRLGIQMNAEKRAGVYRINLDPLVLAAVPEVIRMTLPALKKPYWRVSFESPTPEGAEYLGRNHRFVATLAQYLLEDALTQGAKAKASRCGAIKTKAVTQTTDLYLLRIRYVLKIPERQDAISEEVLALAFDHMDNPLPDEEALVLLQALPDANLPMASKEATVRRALDRWPSLQSATQDALTKRSSDLADSHRRVRKAVGMRIRELDIQPLLPPDLLGVLVLEPA